MAFQMTFYHSFKWRGCGERLKGSGTSTTTIEVLTGASPRDLTNQADHDEKQQPPSTGPGDTWAITTNSQEEVHAIDGKSRMPVYGRAFRRPVWSENKDVNMPLMVFSRIALPVVFVIFNMCYWGAAITYLNTIDSK